MVSAAELIAALQRKLRLTHYRARPGEFPAGWQAWLDQMRDQADREGSAVTGASAAAIVDVLMQREPARRPALERVLGRWQAFTTLWRQQWQPAQRDERWVRVVGAVTSLLVHLGFALILLWLAIVQMRMAPPRSADEVVTQIEFLGVGTPDNVGGGPPPAPPRPTPAEPVSGAPESVPREVAPAVKLPSITSETPQLTVTPVPAPRMDVVERDVPRPEPPVEQPLVVSKPARDTGMFVLPPSSIEVPQPEIRAPAVSAPSPPLQVQVLEIPELPVPAPSAPAVVQLPTAQIEVESPVLARDVAEVVEREIPVPPAPVKLPQQQPEVTVPVLQRPLPTVRTRTIPEPAAAPLPAPAPAPERPAVELATAPAEPTPRPKPERAASTSPAASPPASDPLPSPAAESVAGTGPETQPAPGAWPTLSRSDDWGDAQKPTPGAQADESPGLFDSDGSVNLATPAGSASPGMPPGTLTEEIADLDRAGTWLRRPSFDVRPNTFAKYWRPNESLLQEWVRKSVTTVRIPIPGTNKHIVCTTVLLVVGGSCTVTDPDLNNQPATARPPPDIPFKPELQEGRGAARQRP